MGVSRRLRYRQLVMPRRVVIFAGLADSLDIALDDCVADRREALAALAADGFPVVLCSGRTRAEIGLIQQQLGISDPFVCENGAAVFVPTGYFPFGIDDGRGVVGYDVVEFGEPHADVLRKLRDVAGRLGIRLLGFSDMSVGEVAADRKMTLLHARLAKFREYEELFRLETRDPAVAGRLAKALRTVGLSVAPVGGEFSRVSTSLDLGPGVRLLRQLYRRADPPVSSVGFGVSAEHLPMLAQVDHPFMTAVLPASGTPRSNVAPRIAPDDMVRLVREIAGSNLQSTTRSQPRM